MAEYIEREAALEILRKKSPGTYRGVPCYPDEISASFREVGKLKAADVVEVVHGRWIHTKKHLWYKDEDGNIDEWRVDVGFHNGPQCRVCGESFCMYCNPNWEDEECEVGHYLCSECGETSKDAHETYCPNCGARMDGE